MTEAPKEIWRLWIAIVVALLGNFEYGIALTVVNTMLSHFSEDLVIEENIGGAVTTGTLFFGAAVGSLVAGPFEVLSGKYAQVWIGFLFASGSLLCGFTNEDKICWGRPVDGCVPNMVLFGRFATGVASGFAIVVSPRYLAEVSPPQFRGALGAMTQLLISLGVFVGLLIGLPLEFDIDIGYPWWRVMFISSAMPAILQISLAFLTFPLFKHSNAELRKEFGQSSSILKSLSSVRKEPSTIEEGRDTKANKDSESQTNQPSEPSQEVPTSRWERCKDTIGMLTQRRYRRCVILGVSVPSVCVLSGISIIGSYSTTIFEDAGLNQAIVGSILFGLGDFVGSFITVVLFDRLGRITMANISFTGMAVSQVAVGLISLMSAEVSGPMAVVFILVFILSYGAGCGALQTAYAPEVVPPELADVILGMGQCLSLFFALMHVLVFPSVLEVIGVLLSFLILGGTTAGCLLFLRIFMIETKGKELEDTIAELTRRNQS